jgi:putative tryptophan/tyrosine transport system substrate-binding protein
MRRRDFLSFVGGAVAACPHPVRAQQPLPEIGYLYPGSRDANEDHVAAFQQGLSEVGYIDGRNLTIEYRWANDQNDMLPAYASELVRRRVAVIVASPAPAAQAAKAATTTIPIVFQIGADPVKLGLVASLSRPGGNLTGVSQLSTTLIAKRLELLHDLVPRASVIAVLSDPQGANIDEQLTILGQAARALGLRTVISSSRDIDSVFASLADQQANALFVTATSYLVDHRDQITLLAARHRLPAIYESRDFAIAGGLISYGTDFSAVYRPVGLFAGRIVKGEKPADIPVVQPTKFELVINLKTAKSLGLTVPQTLLATADEVIE